MNGQHEQLLAAAEILRERLVRVAGVITMRDEDDTYRMADHARMATDLHRGWVALHQHAIAILDPEEAS